MLCLNEDLILTIQTILLRVQVHLCFWFSHSSNRTITKYSDVVRYCQYSDVVRYCQYSDKVRYCISRVD